MTQMTQCDDGHFYDREQNAAGCPFCGVGRPDLTKQYPGPEGSPQGRKVDDERTRAYGAAPAAADTGRDNEVTIGAWHRGGIDPVVGFLICTEGANQGRDYRIRSGYNNIGRDTSQQICIVGDESISRNEHAKIFYDPENAQFHVIAGSGRSGIYLNGQVVLQPMALKAYDVMKIGVTKLTFLPFCGERFRWDTAPQGTTPPAKQGPGPAPGPKPHDPELTQGVR